MTIDQAAEHRLLRRYWYAAAYSSALEAGPVAITILGEPVVVVRLDDTVVAARDRCPHRGAPLSAGFIAKRPEGQCLVCPYHGLHFGRTGAAVHLPARPGDRLPARADLELFRCIERHGIVWVSLDPNPLGTVPDFGTYDDPAHATFQLEPEPWRVMASRIAENFNDLAHFPIVHAATFGDAGNPEVPIESIEVADDATTIRHGLLMHQLDRVTIDGPAVPIDVEYSYTHTMPFSTELSIEFGPNRLEWIQISATPTGPTSALVFQQNARNFDLDGDLEGWRDFQAAVNDEDRRLLETLWPARIALDGSDSSEVSLAVDAFTIAYRRLWRTLLAEPI
jgi:vanillate O-demethylase monooxygenase subunit